jgi:hypothetical protein
MRTSQLSSQPSNYAKSFIPSLPSRALQLAWAFKHYSLNFLQSFAFCLAEFEGHMLAKIESLALHVAFKK